MSGRHAALASAWADEQHEHCGAALPALRQPANRPSRIHDEPVLLQLPPALGPAQVRILGGRTGSPASLPSSRAPRPLLRLDVTQEAVRASASSSTWSAAVGSGRRSMNVLPCPSALSTPIVPPCCSMIPR